VHSFPLGVFLSLFFVFVFAETLSQHEANSDEPAARSACDAHREEEVAARSARRAGEGEREGPGEGERKGEGAGEGAPRQHADSEEETRGRVAGPRARLGRPPLQLSYVHSPIINVNKFKISATSARFLFFSFLFRTSLYQGGR